VFSDTSYAGPPQPRKKEKKRKKKKMPKSTIEEKKRRRIQTTKPYLLLKEIDAPEGKVEGRPERERGEERRYRKKNFLFLPLHYAGPLGKKKREI